MIVSVGISDWIKENPRERFLIILLRYLEEDQVGPKIGAELKEDAVVAILFSLFVILIYLGLQVQIYLCRRSSSRSVP
jgi:hypothetical protein